MSDRDRFYRDYYYETNGSGVLCVLMLAAVLVSFAWFIVKMPPVSVVLLYKAMNCADGTPKRSLTDALQAHTVLSYIAGINIIDAAFALLLFLVYSISPDIEFLRTMILSLQKGTFDIANIAGIIMLGYSAVTLMINCPKAKSNN